jgi:hypothetical protein
MSARPPDPVAEATADKPRAGSPRAGSLLRDHSWWLLAAMLACGSLVYLLVRDALPAGVALVLSGLAANFCALAVLVVEAEREARK